MTVTLVFQYLALWSVIGALAFSVIVIILFRTGAVYNSRDERGHLKERISLRGILTMLAFIALVVAFLAITNYVSFISRGVALSFWMVFLLNFFLILILTAYDTLVIDWWVIGIWRPAFLQLPETMNRDEMKVHIKRTLVVAPGICLVLALLSAGVTSIAW